MRYILFGFAFFLFPALRLAAQCDRVGWVASVTPNCGVKIFDLNSGERFRAVSGGNGLGAGQTVSFGIETAQAIPGCPNDNLPVVALTCVSNSLPCKAEFVPYPNELNPMTMNFGAQVYDPAAQHCKWDFGDGFTGAGLNTSHTYNYEGYFDVTLTVTGDGCTASKARKVYVSPDNISNCRYDIAVTAVGMNLFGKIAPISSVAGQLVSVNWFFSKTNESISHSTDFEHPLSAYGSYNVCAEFQTKQADGATCNSTLCKRVAVAEPGCLNPAIADNSSPCPSFSTPVCGCDGVSYGNECEAISAGVTTWWTGTCGASSTGTCSADMTSKIVAGSPDNGYTVLFKNQAGGSFGNLQLDFGDGSPFYEALNWDTVSHFYPKSGVYLTNLTAWKEGSCVSSMTQILTTDVASAESENMPSNSGLVMPGDANGDKKADVYDLLNVGVGYFNEGAPRPNASPNWVPQMAANWPEATPDGINFKHMDCDGNGAINELDPTLISAHYSPIDSEDVVLNPVLPQVWLDFGNVPDTIYLDPAHPAPFEISADIMVASPQKPVSNLYGLAFALRYPDFMNQVPEVEYYDNSDFGISNHILWMPKNIPSRRQLDLGFVRKNGVGVNGSFKIAKATLKADFIIIVDIIDRAATNAEALAVNIKSLKAIDPSGMELQLTVPAVPDTIWVKIKTSPSSGVHNSLIDNQISISPNPATALTTVSAKGLKIEKIEAVNLLGQTVRSFQISGEAKTEIPVGDWAAGVYTLRIQTEKGIAEKKLVVK